jgi:[acyl-carrier-protein] S-malonyltransferase
MIEFGNGSVLKGMNRKIIKSVPTLNVSDNKSLDDTLEKLNG